MNHTQFIVILELSSIDRATKYISRLIVTFRKHECFYYIFMRIHVVHIYIFYMIELIERKSFTGMKLTGCLLLSAAIHNVYIIWYSMNKSL